MSDVFHRQSDRRERRAVFAGVLASFLALAAGVGFFYILRIAGVGVPEKSFADLSQILAPYVDIRTPEGDGPFPAVIILHGCGGQQPMHDRYAEIAMDAGAAAVIVDSLTPRGISRADALLYVCTGAILQGRERAGDLAVALDIARNDPRIDPARLAVAGWSHGGWTIMDLMTLDLARGRTPQGVRDTPVDALEGVGAAFLVYPFCQFPALARDRLMLHPATIDAVIGANDLVVGLADCVSIFRRESEQGREVSWEIWAALGHAFDDPDQPGPFSERRYDAAATARLEDTFARFIVNRLTGAALALDDDLNNAPRSPTPEAR